MKSILFITQKIHENDDDLAFTIHWVNEFIKQGFNVKVVCLEKGAFNGEFEVHSLGKEDGKSKASMLLRFLKIVWKLEYDLVFVHMNPEYFTIAGWYWAITGRESYLWYTHYTDHLHLRLASFFSKKMFAATQQSLPQYSHLSKRVITGHGIDTNFWMAHNISTDANRLLMVNRLSRSKRVDLALRVMTILPINFTLTIYGRAVDEEYFQELKQFVINNNLEKRVKFHGPVPMRELRNIYPKYKILLNLATETIDKTMLEAMCNGLFPVTTSRNSEAIGLEGPFIEAETAESIAAFIQVLSTDKSRWNDLEQIAKTHSLTSLVSKITKNFD